MQDIRNILSIAAAKVISGDLQSAITYYETSFSESQKIDYIGGYFVLVNGWEIFTIL